MNKTVSRNQTKMAGKNIHLMIGSFVLLLMLLIQFHYKRKVSLSI